MKIYSYVIEHDLGFAPNPFHGFCTLACCKPKIRKHAKIGDYILGMGAVKPKLSGHLCCWMRVDEILTFDEYWNDPRFKRKRPVMIGTTYLRYGDNIYHRVKGEAEYRQEDSFHSRPNGEISGVNRRHDTGSTDKILVSRTFGYFGRSGIRLPKKLLCFKIRGPGHRCRFNSSQIEAMLSWIETLNRGFIDEPAHWQFLERRPKVSNPERKK